MSTLTTKVTITLTATMVGLGAAATPALAGDAAVAATVTPQETLAHAIRSGAIVLAVVAGVVLLSKLLQSYRRSQWRRQWIMRSTALYVGSAQLGWPSGSISGRATGRSLSTPTTMAAAGNLHHGA